MPIENIPVDSIVADHLSIALDGKRQQSLVIHRSATA